MPTPNKPDDASVRGAERPAQPSAKPPISLPAVGPAASASAQPAATSSAVSDDEAALAARADAQAEDAEAKLARMTEAPDPYLGTILGERYKVLQKLGAGGMGAVYLAEHVVIERKVAIKILSQDFAHKADLVQRFIQEARAAARIGHENIVEVYDFGETASGSVFFAMEYLEGQDLAQLIQKAGSLPAARVRHIALQICRALAAAHTKKIVHRDLKPENIYLIEREGRTDFVKVLDFGIAKMSTIEEGPGRLTRTGMIFGTPEYMSPEQARGEVPDHRVDIYALGCILYEMLTGRVPFQAETFMGTLTKHMFEMPEPPSRRCRIPIPPELEAVCLRAMEKDRDRRFQTMQDVAQGLESEGPLPPLPPLVGDPSLQMQAANMQQNMLQAGMNSLQNQQMMAGYQQQMQQLAQQQYAQQQYAQQMMMQSGGYGMPGQVQGQLQGNISGVIAAPMQGTISGVVAAPMQGTLSGMMPAPMIPGMPMQSIGGYEAAQPSSRAMGRRLVFIFGGATIGVLILVLLLWPRGTEPLKVKLPPRTIPQGTSDNQPTKTPAQPAKAPQARLLLRGLPDSRVLIESVDVGIIPASGEFAYDVISPSGTSEWSVYIKVVKNNYSDFATRQMLRSGGTVSLLAEQAQAAPPPASVEKPAVPIKRPVKQQRPAPEPPKVTPPTTSRPIAPPPVNELKSPFGRPK